MWKILFAVVLLALMGVGVGVWYHLQELKHEREVAEQRAEEKRRKNEILARQKASANEKKDKSEKVLAELRKEGAEDYGGELFRKIEALYAAGVNAISRGMYTDACAQFDEMIKVAPECKQAMEQAKKQAQEKRAKANAEKMKGEAEAAAKECERLNAETFAEQSWNEAAASLKDANNKFKYGDFPAASNAFAVAIRQFEICTNEVAAVLKAKEAVVPIRKQALEWQSRLKDVSGDEDIEASKNDLANTFARANTLFSDKERRWSDAVALYTNYVKRADKLIQLYKERRTTADAARKKADNAKVCAENKSAKQYVPNAWRDAVSKFDQATRNFDDKKFKVALDDFMSAAGLFKKCEEDAKVEQRLDKNRAWIGTWVCSTRNVTHTTFEYATGGGKSYVTFTTDEEFEYVFKEDGTFIRRVKSETETTSPGPWWTTKTTKGPQKSYELAGRWSVSNNVLLFFGGDGSVENEDNVSDEAAFEKFTIRWLEKDAVELREIQKDGNDHSGTYDKDGTFRSYREFIDNMRTTITTTITPKILRRK